MKYYIYQVVTTMFLKSVITILIFTVSVSTAFAYENLSITDNEHARTWKEFAEKVYSLHEKQLAENSISTKSEVGGYHNHPDSYVEVSYLDKETGLLLSRIKWRKENPDSIHVIEVYIYDNHGNLIRDYTVAYVAFYYGHLKSGAGIPNQALVNFYNYNEELEAFRSFDADGMFVYEACTGKYKGQDIEILLDDEQLNGPETDSAGIVKSVEYKACFDGLPVRPGEYLDPR